MKFTRLVDKCERLISKHKQGSQIKPVKLGKLQQLLGAKKSRYETKLEAAMEPDKRKKLEARLKVVIAQIEKSKQISPAG